MYPRLTPSPDIERIDHKREPQPDTDAVYFLNPKPHIVDCLMADFDRRRYKGAFLIWTTLPAGPLRERLERSQMAQQHSMPMEYLCQETLGH